MNIPQQPFNGFYYPGQIPTQQTMPKTGNWLPPEKLNLVQKLNNQFTLSVSEEAVARGQCNHYNMDGSPALIPDQDGSGGYTCAICGTHFTSREFSQEDVAEATKIILDILNTIKIMYLSLDPSAAMEFFQMVPFIEKIPQLYTIAVNDFKKYEGVNPFINSNTINPIAVFNMMMNPGMMQQPMYQGYSQQGFGYAQQPMSQGFAQPNMGMNPNMSQPAGYNPVFGQVVAQPQQMNNQAGYTPQTQGFSMNPTGGPQQNFVPNPMSTVPPQQGFNTNMPTATAAMPVEDVKVNTEFKK